MRQFITALILAAFWTGSDLAVQVMAESRRPNILFIAIDDMNDWVGCLEGHPDVQSPNIDRLASRGVLFTNAHCTAPVCGPSRTALFTGLRPDSTGVYTNAANVRTQLPHVVTLPQYLRGNGYYTFGCGKLFHGGGKGIPLDAFDEYGPNIRTPWTAGGPFTADEIDIKHQKPSHKVRRGNQVFELPLNKMPADRYWKATNTFDWGPVDLPDEHFTDTHVARWAVERLGESHDKPFFLGVGFLRPHQPMYNPKRFHDLYPPDRVHLPPMIDEDLADLSKSGREFALIPATSGTHATVVEYNQWRNAVSSYLASISYIDELTGQVLSALAKSEYADNTHIVLWSDHGWHLGEKEHWGKATGWYRASRVPLIVVPAAQHNVKGFESGTRSSRPVNLLDLYPTVVELAGLPPRDELDGRSLLPWISDPKAPGRDYTVTTFGRGNHAVTTERWRYVLYFDGSEELYDLRNDPHEWRNVAGSAEHANVKNRLRNWVPEEARWKRFIRYRHFKAVVPADGSDLLLFDHSRYNNIEERASEAADHPDVVQLIENYLKKHRPLGRRIVIEDE